LALSLRKSKLPPDENLSIEIIPKRPAFLKRRKKGSNDNTFEERYNIFKQVGDESTASEDGHDASKQVVPSPSTENKAG